MPEPVSGKNTAKISLPGNSNCNGCTSAKDLESSLLIFLTKPNLAIINETLPLKFRYTRYNLLKTELSFHQTIKKAN